MSPMSFAMPRGRLAIGGLLLLLSGCWGNASQDTPAVAPPSSHSEEVERTAVEALHRQLELDTLYLTDEGERFVAPDNSQRAAVDPATKKLGWAAWQCENPQCPARQSAGQPVMFIWKHPLLFVKEDGTMGMRSPETEEDFQRIEEYGEVKCPACLKIRDLSAETDSQRRQYQFWCRRHLLPQAADQRGKLEVEYRRLMGTEGGN